MSSYQLKAKDRKTGEEIVFDALDDYFGRHRYGYSDGDTIHTEEEFFEKYDPIVSLP